MEPEGTESIFKLSIDSPKLSYTEFYGDRDSKSHTKIKNVNAAVTKKECIGHVQRRVGKAPEEVQQESHK